MLTSIFYKKFFFNGVPFNSINPFPVKDSKSLTKARPPVLVSSPIVAWYSTKSAYCTNMKNINYSQKVSEMFIMPL